MNILLNSGQVLMEDGPLLLTILATLLWGTLISLAVLLRLAGAQRADASLSALALGGWPVPALLLSAFLLLGRLVLPPGLASICALSAALAAAVLAAWSLRNKIGWSAALPFALFALLLALRLGYARSVLLPPYFDSAEHYRIIRALLDLRPGAALIWPTDSYYHIGFHLIAASLSALSGASPARLMILLGQVIVASLPVPVFFLVYEVTGSRKAGLIGVTLAAIGWSMPAHAANWGKYPALLGLLVLQFALGAAMLRQWRLFALAVLCAALIQTRTIILLAALALGWLASRLSSRALTAACIAALAAAAYLLLRFEAAEDLAVTYAVPATLLAGLLAFHAPPGSRRDALAGMMGAAAMLVGMFIPAGPALSLLDRPLVQMSLFLPLAFAGGAGAAGVRREVCLLAAAGILIYGLSSYSFAPSPCCQLVRRDDLAALNWIGRNLPQDARVGIAAADIRLAAGGPPLRSTGADAGIWIGPLTGRRMVMISSFTNFTDDAVHRSLCKRRVGYLYTGSMQDSFRDEGWLAPPGRYELIFALPEAQIVRVIGCQG